MVLKLKWRKFPALLFTVLVSCTLIHTAGRIWHPSAYLWTSFQPYLVQVTSTADQTHNKLKDSSSDVEYDYSDGSSNKEVIPRAKKYSMYWPSQRNSHHWSRRFVDDSPIVYVPTERPFQPSTTEESSLYAPLEKFKSFLALPKSFGSLFDSSVNKEQTPSPFPEFLKVNYSKEELKAFPPVSISIQVSGDDEDYTFSSVNEEVDTVDIKPTAKNVTPSNARLLIYNRVPKCGSTTFNSILDRLLKKQKFPPPWWFDMTLDDCIEVGRPECHPSSPQMNMQLTFFCGHHPECRKVGSRWALYRAKRHAEQYYSVVGILEEFTLSLSVLEGYLPRYFGNVHNIRLSSGEVKLNTNNSPSSRKRVSPATLETLQSLLKEDLEFYEFLRQRLHLQAMALGILTT